MTIPCSNLLIKNYAPGKWHFTYNPDSGKKEKDEKHNEYWFDRFPRFGGGYFIHLVDEKGDELRRVSLSDHLPGFMQNSRDTTAGRLWTEDVFAFIHKPVNQPERLFAVIVPWWRIESCLVIDLINRVPASSQDYDIADIRCSYTNKIKDGVVGMVKALETKAELKTCTRPEAAEQWTSDDSIIHHVGMMQNFELEGKLRMLKAKSFDVEDNFKTIFHKSMAALHRLGFDDESELIMAATNGQVERMQELLARGAYVNFGRRTFYHVSNIATPRATALHCAVEYGQVNAVKFLLEIEDIDVNAKDNAGQTPLFKASTMEVLKILLADPRTNIAETSHGKSGSPLYHFCLHRDKSFVEALLGHIRAGPVGRFDKNLNADPNMTLGRDGTCLHAVCRAGRPELVPMLVEAGCDVNAKAYFHETPLLAAVEAGHTEVVRALMQCDGVDVSATPKERYSGNKLIPSWAPLMVATSKGQSDIVSLILQYKGITLAVVKPALDLAVQQDKQSMVALFLDSELADAEWAQTAFVAASEHGNLKMCKSILGHPKMSLYGKSLDSVAVPSCS